MGKFTYIISREFRFGAGESLIIGSPDPITVARMNVSISAEVDKLNPIRSA
jgi:hypothetical protein